MGYLPYALLTVGVVNILHKCLELRALGQLGWVWVLATAVGAIITEVFEVQRRMKRRNDEIPDSALLSWGPRLVLVAPLAILQVNAIVTESATDSVHRLEFRGAILQEQAALSATQSVWSSSSTISAEDYKSAILRKQLLSERLEALDTSVDLTEVARDLDEHLPGSLLSSAPEGGYARIVSTGVRISAEERLREWSGHIGDVLLQLFFLLLPYVLGEFAFKGLEYLKARSTPDQQRQST